jgi:hypothetical protein
MANECKAIVGKGKEGQERGTGRKEGKEDEEKEKSERHAKFHGRQGHSSTTTSLVWRLLYEVLYPETSQQATDTKLTRLTLKVLQAHPAGAGSGQLPKREQRGFFSTL